MVDNGLILDHNCYQFRCDLEPVVNPTPDQLVGGSNPTRMSSPGTPGPQVQQVRATLLSIASASSGALGTVDWVSFSTVIRVYQLHHYLF